MQKFVSEKNPDFEYYIKGTDPKLLIHTGTHGDEYEVIDIVKKCLEKYEDKLPDFVFVPKVSPSAVIAKTRKNINNIDINRHFFNDSSLEEIKQNIDLIKNYKFDLFISFHEDLEFDTYYLYDQTLVDRVNHKVLNHNNFLKNNGISLLSGVDDPNDLHLGYEFIEGYKMFVDEVGMEKDGSTTVWAMSEEVCKESLTPEIPGKLPINQKEFIVDSFFKFVLL